MNKHRSARWARFTAVIAVISLFALIGCQLQITESSIQPPQAQDGGGVSASAQAAVPANPPAWDANTLYNRAGLYVTHKGKVWVSQWYITLGAEPGANDWNGWKIAEVPSMDKDNPKPWSANVTYSAKGYYVKHRGKVWVSQWSITRGAEPGANAWNGWKQVTQTAPAPLKWAQVAAGEYHSLALNSRGELYAWGDNLNGQLGDGTNANRTTPVRIGTASNWTHIAAGYFHSLAVNSNKELYAWGKNSSGQLGDGTNTDRNTPTRIGTAADWKHITGGHSHSIAINTAGELYAWGSNGSGKLGDNSQIDKNIPTRIGTAANWDYASASFNHSMAVNSSGELYGWGYNGSYGKLGDGTSIIRRLTPTRIGTASNWKHVYLGKYHSLGINTDGELYAWGKNDRGQLGDGTNTNRNTPVSITTVQNSAVHWSYAAAGGYHNLAVKTNGELYAWGSNAKGKLGDGTKTSRNAPVRVGTNSNYSRVSAGFNHSLAISSKGDKLYAWGSNSDGRLGDGTTTDRLTPVMIAYPSGYRYRTTITVIAALYPNGFDNPGAFSNGVNISIEVGGRKAAGGITSGAAKNYVAAVDHPGSVTIKASKAGYRSASMGPLNIGANTTFSYVMTLAP